MREKIEKEFKKRKLNIDEVAREIGVSYHKLWNWINVCREPKATPEYIKFLELLGLIEVKK